MGILNVTPDSFSGDGLLDAAEVADRALRMVDAGADLLDIGAESTRPDHDPIDAEAEYLRLAAPLRAVRRAVEVPITVDTSKAEVAARAFEAGADALNDVHGLRSDPELAPLLARTGKPAVVMHNQRGRTFGGNLIADVRAGLKASMALAHGAGVPRDRLIVDPGFGFGWGPVQNLEMLRRLDDLRGLGRPVLLGTSRKSTIGHVLDRPEQERRWGTAATLALAVRSGVDIVRVHDVEEMTQVVRMADAVVRGWPPEA
ncbi:MAG: dihydropteroate synthase [Dehalococcoidia bacterium]|nr:dihydropteroate synthase [Dehalococcoidia bacterium]